MSEPSDRDPPGPQEPEAHRSYETFLAHCVDRLLDGEQVDAEALRAAHPEIAGRLLEDLESFLNPEARDDEEVLGTLGDYKLLRKIGRGGMGVVYEAWENSIGRSVALKVLPGAVAADTRAAARFLREAQAAGRLSHANVVSVYAMGVREQTPYYAMEYVEGETLAQVLAQLRETPEEAPTPLGASRAEQEFYFHLARAFADVADGLHHAHSKKIIHRDIKPSNLILDREGRLRILDFGLARLEGQESLTLSGDFVGTPLYMSPEQARRKQIAVDHRTDIYSLGATLYEMLTGQPPFRGKDHADTLSQIMDRDPVDSRTVNPRVPRDLETIVLKCLRKDASDRYGTAEALGQDLRRFVRGDAIEARPQPRMVWLARALVRWKRRIAVGAVALLVVVLIVLLALAFQDKRRRIDEARYRELVTRGVEKLQLERFLGGVGPARVNHRLQTAALLRGGFRRLPDTSDRSRIEEALGDFTAAAQIYPRRPEARYHLARALIALGRDGQAVAELGRMATESSGFVPARTLLAEVYSGHNGPELAAAPRGTADVISAPWANAWLALRSAATRGEWAEAESAATDLMDAEQLGEAYLGSSLEARLLRGIARLERADLDGAARDFSMASSLWPGAMTPALLLGQTYVFAGKAETAEKWLDDCFARTDRKEELAFEVACMFLNPSLLRNARARALRWLQRIPEGFVRDRARMYALSFDRQDVPKAIAIGEEILKALPDDSLALAIMGFAWLKLPGEEGRALAFMDRALEASRGDPYVSLVLGDCHFWLGDHRRSETLYRQAIAAAPDFYWARIWLADSLKRQGRYQETIAVAQEALKRASGDPFLLVTLGIVHYLQRDHEAASRCLTQALEMDPQNVHVLYALGHFEVRRGNYDAGENYLKRALEVEPAQPYTLGGLGLLHSRREEFDDALAAFSDAVFSVTIREDLSRYLRELSSLLRFRPRAQRLACLDDLAGRLEAVVAEDSDPVLIEGHALVLLNAPGRKDPERALRLARRAMEASGGEDGDILSTLATIEYACGGVAEAIETVERAVRLPGAKKFHYDQLVEYCRDIQPARELEPLRGEGLFPWTTQEDREWARQELEAHGAIRMRSGVGEYTDGRGRTWGRDRFFGGGNRFLELAVEDPPEGFDGDISGTEDDPIYQNERSFSADGLYSGYRIPLPAGSYRVTLHFAEILYKGPATRVFGVLVEDIMVLDDYEPLKRGFATADVHSVEARVDDGVLNIDFVWKVDAPKISAILVEALD